MKRNARTIPTMTIINATIPGRLFGNNGFFLYFFTNFSINIPSKQEIKNPTTPQINFAIFRPPTKPLLKQQLLKEE